jgi:hypothetical protein
VVGAVTGLARRPVVRTPIGRSRLSVSPAIAVADQLRPVPVQPVGARFAPPEVAPIPMPSPSMRGLEATIAIASLAVALLLGLLR